MEQIERNPYQFSLIEKNVRRALLHRFPYGVYFVVDGRNASVIAILHAKRDPSSWLDRT
jgi:plasmid stabilization system protein ParE